MPFCHGTSELPTAGREKCCTDSSGRKQEIFLQRAFTVILLATIVVWFLQSFGWHIDLVEDSSRSLLATAAGVITPLFAPLGLGDWRIVADH